MRQPMLRQFDKISFEYFPFEPANTSSKKSRCLTEWPPDLFFQLKQYSLALSLQRCPPHKHTLMCIEGSWPLDSLCATNVFWHTLAWCFFKDILSGALKRVFMLYQYLKPGMSWPTLMPTQRNNRKFVLCVPSTLTLYSPFRVPPCKPHREN